MKPARTPWTGLAASMLALGCAAAFAACPLSDDEKPRKGRSLENAASLCTDGTRLFIAEDSPSPNGKIKAVTPSGPSNPSASFATVAEGLDHPTCLLTDGEALFWVENVAAPGGTVRRSGLDGGQPQVLVSGLDTPHAIALNRTHLFLADRRGGVTTIQRVPKAGGEVTPVATLASDFATMLAADDSWVYYTAPYDAPNGFIGRVPVDGGTPEPVATGLGTPNSLVLSGGMLCFTEFQGGKVGCVPDVNASLAPDYLATGESINFGLVPGLLMIDGGTVYYAISDSATIDAIRMVIPGYAPVTIATTESFSIILGMAVVGSRIYWLEHDSLFQIDKSF